MDEVFEEDRQKLEALYTNLKRLALGSFTFEERFLLLELHFPLEDLQRAQAPGRPIDTYYYCFFVNQNGIRFLPLGADEMQLAHKIKGQQPLSQKEKHAALFFLRKLAL